MQSDPEGSSGVHVSVCTCMYIYTHAVPEKCMESEDYKNGTHNMVRVRANHFPKTFRHFLESFAVPFLM